MSGATLAAPTSRVSTALNTPPPKHAYTPPSVHSYPMNWTPVDPTKLQPNIPAQFRGGIEDPSDAANAGKPIPASALVILPTDAPDVVAMKKNGGQPVIIADPSHLTPSSIGISTEYTPWYQEPDCVQPPANFDAATATDAQLALYGFPPRKNGESPSAYAARVSWMKTRVCEFRIGNATHRPLSSAQVGSATKAFNLSGNNPTNYGGSGIWGGNIADEPCVDTPSGAENFGCHTPYLYDQIAANWTLKGISGTNTCSLCGWSAWLGLGGITGTDQQGYDDPLVQSGSEDESSLNRTNTYELWVENVTQPPIRPQQDPIYPWGMASTHYGIGVYAEEWGDITGNNAEALIGDTSDDLYWSTSVFNGVNYGYDTSTAEAIVERQTALLPKFSTQTFNGVSIFEAETFNNARNWTTVWHDYFGMYDNGHDLVYNPPISYDPNWVPPYDSAVTWEYYQ